VVVWNLKLSQIQLRESKNKQRGEVMLRNFYHHNYLEPIHISDQNYSYPVLWADGKLHKMVSLTEFMERLIIA